MLAACRTWSLADLRDRALLLLGYAGALRRADLAAVAREYFSFTPEGLRLHISRSMTDTAGQGAELGISRAGKLETCPVRTLEAWLQASGCRFGPVFRKVNRWGDVEPQSLHPDAVRQILCRRAAAGLTVFELERLSPHGLRANFITEAYRQGARRNEGERPSTASMCQNAGCRDLQRRPPAMSITRIGVDLAKPVFQLRGIDASGKLLLKRKLPRGELMVVD